MKRRNFIVQTASASLLATMPAQAASRAAIDRRIGSALTEMRANFSWSQELERSAAALLVVPRILKAGLIFGGAYGEGALLINNVPVDYYSLVSGSWGAQIGAARYTSVLFIMTDEALTRFRTRDGWTVGLDLEAAAPNFAESVSIDSNTAYKEVYGLTFSQKGLLIGASIEGAKYSRIYKP